MSKCLVIAEKPSVAQDISRALAAKSKENFSKEAEWFESDHYIVTSAVGHLLELAAPEAYDVKRGKWSFKHLPVIPPSFDLIPMEKTKPRLNAIKKLIKRKDVDEIINACDAGREGELIFRYIVKFCHAKQPLKRLWLQSMTQQAIIDGFATLKQDKEVIPLAQAAQCRSEADWLVGINATRAMTAFNSSEGGFFLTPVGRVQTPTLSIVVARDEQIRRFVSKPYFEVTATFAVAAGSYQGKWVMPDFKKLSSEDRPERIWEKQLAEKICTECDGKSGLAKEETKPLTQNAPPLFDLTSLQREANARFGLSAKATLSILQTLYESHKVLTYPRTDSKALPEDYINTVKKTLQMLEHSAPTLLKSHVQQILTKNWVVPNKRIFDNTKVSDHFAIIPTLVAPKGLKELEQKLYDLVLKRFLAVFFPPARYLVTSRTTSIDKHQFKTEGRVLVEAGWLAVYGSEVDGDPALVPLAGNGEKAITQTIALSEHQTKPPARFTEATLLSAMENAGKLVEDEDLSEAMLKKGLGTPATRATIIEGLITEQYLSRQGRELISTAKAYQLMTLLRGLQIEELTKPELTGQWEFKLAQMQQGEYPREEFMQAIRDMTQKIVAHAKNCDRNTVPGGYATLQTPCPHCGAVVKENYHRFVCTSCSFSLGKHPGGRLLELDEVEQLLQGKTLGPLQGFRSKMGRPFSALLKLVKDADTGIPKIEFDFGNNAPESLQNLELGEVVGKCPKCQANVHATPNAYWCTSAVNQNCDFKIGRIILQQPIEPNEVSNLLAEGKTSLLKHFVSTRTKRPFSAYLVLEKGGKISFNFEPRAAVSKISATTKTEVKNEATAKKPRVLATRKTSVKTTGTKAVRKKSA